MSTIFNKYIKNEDHCWYDSSNILYSVLFDDQTANPKSLKIVFKGGRTYLYRNVNPNDYVLFKNNESQGRAFNTYIKSYEGIQLENTDLNELDSLKQQLENNNATQDFCIKINNATGEFALMNNGNVIHEGIEGQVSIINLFTAMGITYTVDDCGDDFHIQTVEDFETKKITI